MAPPCLVIDTGMLSKNIGIIGFGNQGKPWAQNLQDSGWNVHALLRPESKNIEKAKKILIATDEVENLSNYPVLALLLPDDAIPSFFASYGHLLKPNQTVVFAHGFCLHYQTVAWPSFLDLVLVAPKGIGSAVREEFEKGRGVPCVTSVHQNATGQAQAMIDALCEGLGATRAGVYPATAQQEVEADLFSEQALLCGGIPALVFKSFEILVKNGVQPEVAYLECVHELGFMAKLFQEKGFFRTMQGASPTAQFGGALGGQRLVDASMEKKLNQLFEDIRQNRFAKSLSQESGNGYPATRKNSEDMRGHPAEKIGDIIREKLYFKTNELKGES